MKGRRVDGGMEGGREEGWMEGRREGGMEGRKEGGREGRERVKEGKEGGWMEGRREGGWREGGRVDGEKEEGREGGGWREGGREGGGWMDGRRDACKYWCIHGYGGAAALIQPHSPHTPNQPRTPPPQVLANLACPSLPIRRPTPCPTHLPLLLTDMIDGGECHVEVLLNKVFVTGLQHHHAEALVGKTLGEGRGGEGRERARPGVRQAHLQGLNSWQIC